ncbi:MAG: hypothetical protein F6J95_015560 [Leptolyngbya sp. SIO1E4]|nr:hypothetical protein [Leptolyngbya sp. SIO1E4]
MQPHLTCVTVIFLNDCWVVRVKLDDTLEPHLCHNCQAVLNENGFAYQPRPAVILALNNLDAGCAPTLVMNRYHLAIVSHGAPNPEEVSCFQEQFVSGLGYCPQSLV